MQCRSCGLLFENSTLIGGGGRAALVNVEVSGPCPRCGGPASNALPAASEFQYEAGEWTLLRLLAPQGATLADYKRLIEVLEQFQRPGVSQQQVSQAIAELVPRFRGLAEFLTSAEGVALATWLTVVLMVGQWVVDLVAPDDGAPPPTVELTNVIVLDDRVSRDELDVAIQRAIDEANRRSKPSTPPRTREP